MKQNIEKHKMYNAILILLFISITLTSYGQDNISKEQLIEDLHILKKSLENNHPGLYAYSSKQELDNWFMATEKKIDNEMTSIDFYKLIARLNSIIKNGHTNVYYPSNGFKGNKILPLGFYKYKNSFYISKTFKKEYENIVGSKIISIDNHPIREIYHELLSYVTRDGENMTMPSNTLMQIFPFYYSFFYDSKANHSITISNKGKEEIISVMGIKAIDYAEIVNKNIPSTKCELKIKDTIAVLTIPTFLKPHFKKNNQNFNTFLKTAFTTIREHKIKHLILDIRENGGGHDTSTQKLISYLYDKKFQVEKDAIFSSRKIADRAYYKNQGLFWSNTFNWLVLKKREEKEYAFKAIGMKKCKPKAPQFKGNLYILISGNTYSAAGEFASFMKSHSDAIFIGEEVGGNKFQNTSGNMHKLTLPNSGVRVTVPQILYIMNIDTANDGHGVTPDYWIRNTIKDELEGNDSVMKFSLDLIAKKIH